MGTTRTLGPKRAAFLPMAFIAVLVDQLGKYHTTTKIDVGAREPLAGDWISLTHMPSMSGAFGFFGDWLPGAQLTGFALLALCATLLIVNFYRGLAPGEQGSAAALGLMLGGISSHGIDRLRFGSGLDFLHLGGTESNALPDFNMADVAIVLGVATLIVELLATEMAARASERPDR